MSDRGLDLGTGGPGVLTIAALTDLDPATLQESALVEVVGRLDEQVAWLHSVRAAHLREIAARHADDVLPELRPGEVRDGHAEPPQWEREAIGARCGITAYEARTRFETAAALTDRLPATAALLDHGAISWQHAVALSQETSSLEPAQAGEVERRVHADARAVTAGQVRRRARRLAASMAPPVDPDAVVERSLTAWSDAESCTLAVRLDREGGAIVATCLDSLATRTGPDDDRPIATRRADALVELCRWKLDSGDLPRTAAGVRPHLTLQVPQAMLASGCAGGVDPASAAGSVSGPAGLAADLPIETLRRIAGVSTLRHGATVCDLGHEQRFATGRLRRLLEARDGGCRFPSCDRPARRCHAHHVEHWLDGGSTSEDNMLLLCSRHHHLVHEGGWKLWFDGATATFFTPDGTAYVAPSPLARPPEPDEDFYTWLPAARGATDPDPPPRPSVMMLLRAAPAGTPYVFEGDAGPPPF